MRGIKQSRIRSQRNGVILLIIGISAAAATIAFIVLVVYLATFIQTAKRSLKGTDETLTRIREELEAMRQQSVSLMAAGEQLVKDVDEKLHTFDPLSRSVKRTGEALEQVSASVRQVSAAVSRTASGLGETVEKNHSKVSDIAELASMGMQLWQRWQSHRTAKSQPKSQVQTMEE
jgi:uncharacterized protein YoxC